MALMLLVVVASGRVCGLGLMLQRAAGPCSTPALLSASDIDPAYDPLCWGAPPSITVSSCDAFPELIQQLDQQPMSGPNTCGPEGPHFDGCDDNTDLGQDDSVQDDSVGLVFHKRLDTSCVQVIDVQMTLVDTSIFSGRGGAIPEPIIQHPVSEPKTCRPSPHWSSCAPDHCKSDWSCKVYNSAAGIDYCGHDMFCKMAIATAVVMLVGMLLRPDFGSLQTLSPRHGRAMTGGLTGQVLVAAVLWFGCIGSAAASNDLQRLQQDQLSTVTKIVTEAFERLMDAPFQPIEDAKATYRLGIIDLFDGDPASRAWDSPNYRMFDRQMQASNNAFWCLGMGLESGHAWLATPRGLDSGQPGFASFVNGDGAPLTDMSFAPYTIPEVNALVDAGGLVGVPGQFLAEDCASVAADNLYLQRGDECKDSGIRLYYSTDSATGLPVNITRWRSNWDPRARMWYRQCKESFESTGNLRVISDVYTTDSTDPPSHLITASEVIFDPAHPNVLAGVFMMDYQITGISTFLTEEFRGSELVVYALEAVSKELLGVSTGTPLVSDNNVRLTAMQSPSPVVAISAAGLEAVAWNVSEIVLDGLQSRVIKRNFLYRGLNWIIVLVQPITCDVNQHFQDGQCVTCPFLTELNPDATTASIVPCVCDEGQFDSSSQNFAFCFGRAFLSDALTETADGKRFQSDFDAGLQCSKCPDCMDCTKVHGLLQNRPGYSTINTNDAHVSVLSRFQLESPLYSLKCPFEGACTGDVVLNGTNATVVAATCAVGFTGHLCAVCDAGYTTTTSGCEQCAPGSVFVIPALIVGLVAAGYLYSIFEAWFTEGGADYADLFFEVERLVKPIIKVSVTTAQIVGSLPSIMQFTFPGDLSGIVAFLRIFAFDVFSILRVNCLFGSNSFYAKFSSSIFLPMALIACFLVFSILKARNTVLPDLDDLTHKQRVLLREEYDSLSMRGGPDESEVTAADIYACCQDVGVDMSTEEIEQLILEGDANHSGALTFDEFLAILHLPASASKFPELILAFDRRRHTQSIYAMVSTIVFMLYPGVCQTAFAALRCRQLTPEISVLEADYNIECTSSTYQAFRVFAVITIILIPIGIPLGAFLWMRSYREKIISEDGDTLRQFNALMGDYEPTSYYWESIELSRKLILAGFIMFVAPGSSVQVGIALLITFMFFALSLRFAPFKNPEHDVVKMISEVMIFVVLLSVMLMRTQDIGASETAVATLSTATAVVLFLLSITVAFFTVFVGHRLIREIKQSMEDKDKQADEYQSTANPMTEDADAKD